MKSHIPVRPEIHFTPSKGWMNDPNGLVHFEGEYHLFYQYYPDSMVGGPMHWGHAVSQDLHQWQELDIALKPDEMGLCFSGSAIVDKNNDSGLFPNKPGLLAFYTVHREVGDFDQGYIQEQCLAYSKDNGRSWEKYEQNPIIKSPGCSDFRDPKVTYHADSNSWIMSLAVGQEIHFYRSVNLVDWEFCSAFGAEHGAHTEHPWECPDLIELPIEGTSESSWVLVVGIGASDDPFGSFTQYFIGDFDGKEFTNENSPDCTLMMDEGRDFYAAQSWSDTPDGICRVIAWMNNWKYAKEVPADNYRGCMSSVRALRLVSTTDGIRLAQTFSADAIQTLGGEKTESNPGSKIGGHNNKVHKGRKSLFLENDSAVEISFYSDLPPTLVIRRIGNVLNIRSQRVVDTGNVEFDRKFSHDYFFEIPYQEELVIEWIIDTSSLEVLFNEGEQSFTQLILSNDINPHLRIGYE